MIWPRMLRRSNFSDPRIFHIVLCNPNTTLWNPICQGFFLVFYAPKYNRIRIPRASRGWADAKKL